MQSQGTEKSTTPRASALFKVNEKYDRYFTGAGLAASLLLACFSMAEVFGWAFDIQPLKRPLGDQPLMQSSAAVTFFIASIALLFYCIKGPSWLAWPARVFGLAVFLTGAATFIEHTYMLDWGLAQVLWQPAGDAAPLRWPGPMVPDVSLNFILLGASLMLFDLKVKNIFPFQILALLVALPNIMILISYACGQEHLCAFFGCVKFSAITSLTFTLACFSVLFLRPGRGITTIFVVDTTGGAQVRRLSIMMLLLIPLLLLIKLGQSMQLYDVGVSVGMMALSFMTLLGAGVFIGARKLDTVEEEKQQVVELLENSIATHAAQQASKMKLVCLQCAREFRDSIETNCPDDGYALIPIVDTMQIGGVFAERYEIVSELGAGGISSVYLARHLLMNKRVALKVLHTHLATQAKTIQRFQQEARAASQLSHPNLIAVHDFGVSTDGQAFLVMEYLAGYSLSEHIRMSNNIPWQEAILVFLQLCDGLQHAHSNGVMHRDLKPSNVMIVQDVDKDTFTAVIVDFGFAKATEADDMNRQQLTATGDVFGSPLYMAPEQCRGMRVDHRSDIYALGVLMYETLAGEVPFLGPTALETMSMHIGAPPPRFEADLLVPEWLEAIVLKSLEKDPGSRQQSANEIKNALQNGLNATRASAY